MSRIIVAVALVLLLAASSEAQDRYPSRTVRLLCWTSAGSPLDVMMRQVARQLADSLGQKFVVENRPGGEGSIAMAALMTSPADGYTILSSTGSMALAMAKDTMRYTPDDFIVLPALQSEPSAIAVRNDSPLKTMGDFVAAVRASPDTMSVGGFSTAGFHQYVLFRLQEIAGFKAVWVPFKGGQDATVALLGGHIQAALITPSTALSQYRAGEIRFLGVSTGERNEYMPDVPTFKEQGYDFSDSLWRGLMVKAGTPKPILDSLLAALAEMRKSRDWKEFSRINMQSNVEFSLDEMNKKVRDEVAGYRTFLKAIDASR